MRFLALVPIVLTFIALILSFLCLFAGRTPNSLETYDILTLNTSRIAVNIFNTSATGTTTGNPTTTSSGFFHSLETDITGEISNLTTEAENDITSALNDAAQSFARAIGLYDFYSIHVLDHCEGFYRPNGTATRHVVQCSNTTAFSGFDPSKTLQQQLNATGTGITLADLHWPSAIDQAIEDLKTGFNVLFVLYCMGITATGLSLFAAVAGLLLHSNLVALLNISINALAVLWLLIASAIVTGSATHAANVINEYGAAIDVNAARGAKLIAMTWTTTVLVALAMIPWMIEMFMEKRRAKMMPTKLETF